MQRLAQDTEPERTLEVDAERNQHSVGSERSMHPAEAIGNFNSIKVRLEPTFWVPLLAPLIHFNSIKVRLELIDTNDTEKVENSGSFWRAKMSSVMLTYQVIGKLSPKKPLFTGVSVFFIVHYSDTTIMYYFLGDFWWYLEFSSYLCRAEKNSTPKGRVWPYFALNIPMWWAR